MASVPRLVLVKEANVSIHAQAHAERMQYVQSITTYHHALVLRPPQEILSVCVLKLK